MGVVQASELRIGNYVYMANPQSPLIVSGSRESAIDAYYLNEDGSRQNVLNKKGYMPIPLTEEWLIKLGFSRGAKQWAAFERINYWDYYIISNGFKIVFVINEYGHIRARTYTNVEHIHQLQNLFFALTNQELTLPNTSTSKEK